MNAIRLAATAAILAGVGAAAPPQGPRLAFPLACKIGVSCEVQNYFDDDPGPGVLDYRCGHRTYEGHNGVDIRIPDMAAQKRGVDVLAAAPGRVSRLRDGVADISIRAANAPSVEGQQCGNGVVIDHGGGWETQYCHLARGSVKVKVGDQVRAGQPLARVGLSGSTEFPHLHISVRHGTTNLDPFAPGVVAKACAAQPSLWTAAAASEMAYKRGAILNAGFSRQAITSMEMVETGGLPSPDRDAPLFVAYARAIGLQRGDVLELTVTAPDGSVLLSRRDPAVTQDRAQQFLMVGKRRPAGGWPKGTYVAVFSVRRGETTALSKSFKIAL